MQAEINLSQKYRGRFAPSPTGPLHFGSLVAAVGSYLEAKSHDGEWLVRIEDLDPPRTVAGTTETILSALEQHQLWWDGEVLYQSQRNRHYQIALDQLHQQQQLFGCQCSRKQLQDHPIYPGHCHTLQLPLARHAVRILTQKQSITFNDRWQGRQQWALAEEIGDFVLRRADGLYAYQLAVVVDDAQQGITDIIRGSDLLDSTPRQIYLQQQLDYPTPRYGHLPIAVTASGQKLSKQNLATPLNPETPVQNLHSALRFLGQRPPAIDELPALWQWAISHWEAAKVPHQAAISVE